MGANRVLCGALFLLLGAESAAGAGPRVCRMQAGEDCAALWAEFTPAGAGGPAVIILTFDGDGYFAGARATIASVIGRARGPLLFAVASTSHAAETADWFSGLALAGASKHALCSVDPESVSEVSAKAKELSGYNRPDHHSDWGAAAPSAIYRVFLRQLFPHATRALYVDADVIVQANAASVVAELERSLPVAAARSANLLKMRMDYCCQASAKVRKLLANTSSLDAAEAEMLQDFADVAPGYREFNNGVMALDLKALDEAGVFKKLEAWLELNLKHKLFDNDQHAWNLAAMLHWQDLQQAFSMNAPSLEMMEQSLLESKPAAHLKSTLRRLAFVHYTNKPKPWQVDRSQAPPTEALSDDGIWLESFQAAGGSEAQGEKIALTVREVAKGGGVSVLRPASTVNEDFEYGMLYMEGSGGLGTDPLEARWRLTRAGAAGDAQAQFMVDRGLTEELDLPDKKKLAKIELCWVLAGQRIKANEDHQTLMGIYKMTEMQYLAKKAPGMVSNCYWRLQSADIAVRRRSPEELEVLFGSSGEQPNVPALTPRLAKWLELVTKDQIKESGVKEAAAKEPPVPVNPWFVLPALGLLAAVVGGMLWRMQQLHGGSGRDKKKKKKHT